MMKTSVMNFMTEAFKAVKFSEKVRNPTGYVINVGIL